MSTSQPVPPPAGRRLVRPRDRRMVAGVCAGLSDYSGIDVTIIRLVVVVGSILGLGSLVVAYLVAWVLMPQGDWPAPAQGA